MTVLAEVSSNPSLPIGYDIAWGIGALVVVTAVLTAVTVAVRRSGRSGTKR